MIFNMLTVLTLIKLTTSAYVSSLYYSEWSYALQHFPSDISLSHITHIYYAFFQIDDQNLGLLIPNESAATSDQFPLNIDAITDDVNFLKKSDAISGWTNQYISNADKIQVGNIHSIGLLGQLSQLKTLNPSLKVILSIGGTDSSKTFSKISKSEKKIDKFVNNVVANVKKFGFDGIDIDWEYPSNENDRNLLSSMIEKFRLVLDDANKKKKKNKCSKERYQLSIAIPLDRDTLQYYDFTELKKNIDYFNLMGYDISGPWSKRVDFQSQLYSDTMHGSTVSVNDTIMDVLSSKIDLKKVVLGMPLYGRAFKADSLYKTFKGCPEISNKDPDLSECEVDYVHLPPADYIEVFDNSTGAAYAYSTNPEKPGIIVYDNPDSARLKARYVKNYNLAGGMWWDSKGDPMFKNTSRSLVYNFVDELGGINVLKRDNCIVNNNLFYGELSNQTSSGVVGPASASSSTGNIAVINLCLIYINLLFNFL